MVGDPAEAAAYAARNADSAPEHVLKGTAIGRCECGAEFPYGNSQDIGNLSPCPECGGQEWEKIGWRQPDGSLVEVDDV